MKNVFHFTVALLLFVTFSAFSCDEDNDIILPTTFEISDNGVVLRAGDGYTVPRNEPLDLSVRVFDGTRDPEFVPTVSLLPNGTDGFELPEGSVRRTSISQGGVESLTYAIDYAIDEDERFAEAESLTVLFSTQGRNGETVSDLAVIGLTD